MPDLIDIRGRNFVIDLERVKFENIGLNEKLIEEKIEEVIGEETEKEKELEDSFKKIEEHIEPKSFDEYELDDFDENEVTIKFTRKMFFEPEIIYKIEIVLYITYDLNQESEKDLTFSNLEKEIEENEKTLLQPAAFKASLLISNISEIDEDLMIMPPPMLNKKQ